LTPTGCATGFDVQVELFKQPHVLVETQRLFWQVVPEPQVPQSSRPPQPFEARPQLAPTVPQVLGMHEPAHVPLLQTEPIGQALRPPQLSDPPQPSGIDPQVAPWAAHVVGTHDDPMHMPP
jgi:hypothetical protein